MAAEAMAEDVYEYGGGEVAEQEAEAEELKEDGRRRGEEGGAAIEGSLLGRVWGRNRAFGRLTVIVWLHPKFFSQMLFLVPFGIVAKDAGPGGFL